jgi:hypothetical protein
VYRSLRDALASTRLQPATDSVSDPFIVEPDLPDGAAALLERDSRGDCVFFERGTRLCVVHRDLGESALPSTCRHFPRIAVRDGRGTFITLSHFCPTAASMLFRTDVPIVIVEQPAAFPAADYEGLAVGEEDLPPLLAPGMLMDPAAYSAWERHMVARCAGDASPEAVLATLARDARLLRPWKPGGATLADAIAHLPTGVIDAPPHAELSPSLALHGQVMAAVPQDLKPEPDQSGLGQAYRSAVRPVWEGFRAPLNRYLAAKAFASWTAYQGRGLATIVCGLEAALALVRVEAARQCRDAARMLDNELLLEAFRSADFALNHLAVGEELAAAWSSVESES